MKTATALKVVISIQDMKALIEKMEKNKTREPAMSNEVALSLCEDSDYRCLAIDKTRPAEQFSSYQECNSMSFDLITT